MGRLVVGAPHFHKEYMMPYAVPIHSASYHCLRDPCMSELIHCGKTVVTLEQEVINVGEMSEEKKHFQPEEP